jgi:sugar-specific transcriptional regulator TrmB
MSVQTTLEELGLGKKSIAIYLAALEQGEDSAGNIAKKSGIQRTAFYDIARQLVDAGFLLQNTDGKKILFRAASPETLLEIQKKRLEKLEHILPELQAMNNIKGVKPRISYYEGRAGIDRINQDTLKYKGEIIGFTTPRFVNFNERQVSREYIEQRKAIKNKVRVIGEVSPEVLELQRRDKEELRETRLLPQTVFRSDIEIGIYGNKTFILDYKQEFGFIIESQEISSVLKMLFEIVWSSGRIIDTL